MPYASWDDVGKALCLSVSVCLSVCPSVRPSVCLSVCLPACLPGQPGLPAWLPARLSVCLLAADLYFFRGLPCHGLCWEEVKLHRVVELCKQTLVDRLTTIITYFATSLRKRFLFTFLQRYNDSDHAECGGISETIPFSNFSAPKDFAIYIGQPTTGRGSRWVDTQLWQLDSPNWLGRLFWSQCHPPSPSPRSPDFQKKNF